MVEETEQDYEEEASETLQQLSQIKAVNDAVLANLEVRSKRDDEKVTIEEKKLGELLNRSWYRNLGGINQAVDSYKNAQTDLTVTHLSIIKQLQEYVKQLTAWVTVFEQAQDQIISLQQLNNNLSLQLKDVDKERNALKKQLEECGQKVEKNTEERATKQKRHIKKQEDETKELEEEDEPIDI